MAYTLSVSAKVSLSSLLQNALDLSTPEDSLPFEFSDTLATGVGLDGANRVWADERTIATGADDDLDLTAGLTDAFGATIVFAAIRGIIIYNKGTGVADILSVGAAAANPIASLFGDVTDKLKIGPGGIKFLWNPSAAGYAVVTDTADILRIHNGGAGDTIYQIIIIGSTAA